MVVMMVMMVMMVIMVVTLNLRYLFNRSEVWHLDQESSVLGQDVE
jgi:TRAP-type C4-dicarboxylate transport system permease small subunit